MRRWAQTRSDCPDLDPATRAQQLLAVEQARRRVQQHHAGQREGRQRDAAEHAYESMPYESKPHGSKPHENKPHESMPHENTLALKLLCTKLSAEKHCTLSKRTKTRGFTSNGAKPATKPSTTRRHRGPLPLPPLHYRVQSPTANASETIRT